MDATQELIATGTSNIANSFVQGFPSTGALSRAAVNNSSGVRTTAGGLYTGVLVILSLLFLTPLFFYIPKAALGGVLIAAVIFMVEVQVIKPIWRSKSELAAYTLINTLIQKFFLYRNGSNSCSCYSHWLLRNTYGVWNFTWNWSQHIIHPLPLCQT